MKYDFASIEKKWQQKWLEEKPFTAVTGDKTREKFFGLILIEGGSVAIRAHSLRPGAPRGPRPALHRHGHHLPEEADAGLQRPVPHRL